MKLKFYKNVFIFRVLICDASKVIMGHDSLFFLLQYLEGEFKKKLCLDGNSFYKMAK